MEVFIFYFFLFFIYSVLGWVVETTFVFLTNKQFVNRGFLIGPYIPIYGTSSIIMILYLTQYKDNPVTVFLLAMFVCSFLEYITSYFMEKLFKARWWDYSSDKYNLNGRVCLRNSVLFGILSIVLIYFINPCFIILINNMNTTWLYVISIVCLIIFITDTIISLNVVLKIKYNFENIRFDATMEIKKLVNNKFKKRYLQKRIFKAFPKLKFHKRK